MPSFKVYTWIYILKLIKQAFDILNVIQDNMVNITELSSALSRSAL
jgi:hypothetical protein